ncbi:MAG: AAA family ATPase [Chloroflexota bacterium]
MKQAILVNGVPASGKSTVARALGDRLGLPVLSLDAVKEVLFAELGHRDADREWGRTLGRASIGSIWALLAGFPPGSTAIVEAWFRRPPHDPVLAGLARAGVDRWVELWCHADPDTLAARYAARERAPGHPAPEDYVEELRALGAIATPMGLSPVLDIDTTDPTSSDPAAIARWVTEQLQPGGGH